MSAETNPTFKEQYYDLPQEEEELSQSFIHHLVIKTLLSILENMFAGQLSKVISSVNIYYAGQAAVCPDVAIIDNLVTAQRSSKNRRSYYIDKKNPAPQVAFEIASDETWSRDLVEKLARYEAMGTQEYYVFDPNNPQAWRKEWRAKGRLVGWRFNSLTHKYEELPLSANGWMWSAELDSWLAIELVEGDPYLRLYDINNKKRLDKDEAKALAKRQAEREVEAVKQQTEREVEAVKRQAEREVEAVKRQAEAELETASQRISELEAILRRLQKAD
jgi:Uma2 family endonuclease